jgi:hypothetical protein
VTEFINPNQYFKGNIVDKQLDTCSLVSSGGAVDLRDLLESEVILIGGGELVAEFH